MIIVERHGAERPANWLGELFSRPVPTFADRSKYPIVTATPATRIGVSGNFRAARLFEGQAPAQITGDRMVILRDGFPVHELALAGLKPESILGRHPRAEIQLEAQRLATFHACLWNFDGEYYIENLDPHVGALLNRKRLKPRYPVRLRDGAVVDLPGYRLVFDLPRWPATGEIDVGVEEIAEVPACFYSPSLESPPCPLRSHLVRERDRLGWWSEGITRLTVAEIIDETPDVKTFRFVGEEPMLFSYKPGQFVTFLLNIGGREVQRSYSMSSTPSRPHTLELTVKRVPEGLVSNWFCDRVKRGDTLRVQGPSGRFTCFDYPSDKFLFIAAGCGVTPIMSMCRWIADTAADVDVKLLASFRTPQEIIFRKELELMSARHRGFRVALTVTSGWPGTDSWTGLTGRVNRQMLNLLAPDYRDRHIFLCGPESFMARVKEILCELEYDMARLRVESFGAGQGVGGARKAGRTLRLSGELHKVTFIRSGLTVDTDEQTTLLDLAEAHGIAIDYSCRSGECGECEVKCRGEVEMLGGCEIDAKLRAAGFVYACSCVAKADLSIDV